MPKQTLSGLCSGVSTSHVTHFAPPPLRFLLSTFLDILCSSGRSVWVPSCPPLVSHCCLVESWALVRLALHALGLPSRLPLGSPLSLRPHSKVTGPGELTRQHPYWRWSCFGSSFAAQFGTRRSGIQTSVTPTDTLFCRPNVWLLVVRAYRRSAVSAPVDLVPDELPMPHPILGLFSLRMQSYILPSPQSSPV